LRYLFEDYALDTDRRELHRATDVIVVTPQVFDLLDYLIRNRERVVSKDDLINAVWNRRIVSDAALTTRVNAARSAIGDTGEKQRLIKTLPRKGFRFVGTVQEVAMLPTPLSNVHDGERGHSNTASRHQPPPLSILVLPFANIGGGPEQDYFADGVTESLTTDLSRISGSFVIGRHTAFAYKDKAVDVMRIGRELNIRYVLEGSVQRSGDRLRVNAQLVDVESGRHLWAERFDKPVADLFDMQDEIVSRLANTLDAQLTEQEARRSERAPHPNSTDLFFQGKTLVNKGLTPEYLAQARGFFERALTLDTKNVGAIVWMANVDLSVGATFLRDERVARLAAAEATILKALCLAPDHAFAHVVFGAVLMATNRAAQAIAEYERALSLDRNLAEAHAQIGWAKFFMGRSAEVEAHLNEAFRLSPRDIRAYDWMMLLGFTKLQLRGDTEAACWFRRSIEANRNYPIAHFGLGAALALLGSLDQARGAANAGLAINPNFTVRLYREGASSDNPIYLAKRERIYEGMRLAGVPEG
jgi:TolB-like protein/Flp pilus assembly protein TadD